MLNRSSDVNSDREPQLSHQGTNTRAQSVGQLDGVKEPGAARGQESAVNVASVTTSQPPDELGGGGGEYEGVDGSIR